MSDAPQLTAHQSLICTPTPNPKTCRGPDGKLLIPPADWSLLPPGDAGLTRRVKAAGPSWTVQEKVGRKLFSRGVWAPTATIERERGQIEAERATPQYQRKQAAAKARRDDEQAEYVEDFHGAVMSYLRFPPRYEDLARRLATAITTHATPVGSGTVARTERITIEERAEAATIAWMRHQTTAYDHMHIPLIKGKRREVRRMLAEKSKQILQRYRAGIDVPETCPLARALAASAAS